MDSLDEATALSVVLWCLSRMAQRRCFYFFVKTWGVYLGLVPRPAIVQRQSLGVSLVFLFAWLL